MGAIRHTRPLDVCSGPIRTRSDRPGSGSSHVAPAEGRLGEEPGELGQMGNSGGDWDPLPQSECRRMEPLKTPFHRAPPAPPI